MSHVKSIQKKTGLWSEVHHPHLGTKKWSGREKFGHRLGTKTGDQEKDKIRVSCETLDLRLVLEKESLVPTKICGQYFKSRRFVTDWFTWNGAS